MKHSIPALQHLQRLTQVRHQTLCDQVVPFRDAIFATLQTFVAQATAAGIQGVDGMLTTIYPPDLMEVRLTINHQPYLVLASTAVYYAAGATPDPWLAARMFVYRGLDAETPPDCLITVVAEDPPRYTLVWRTMDGPHILLQGALTADAGVQVAEALLDHWYDLCSGWIEAPTRAMLLAGDPALVTQPFKTRQHRRMVPAADPCTSSGVVRVKGGYNGSGGAGDR